MSEIVNETTQLVNEMTDENVDNTMIEFLQDVVLKSKRLGHNKLQIKIEEYISQIKSYENEIINLKNIVESLTKENNKFIELNMKQKTEINTINNKYNELMENYNNLQTSSSNEKTAFNNIRISYESQLQKSNKVNENLNMDIENQKKTLNDFHQKFADLKSRYDELASLHSTQTFEHDILKKELKNAKDELDTACLNNRSLHDELLKIKNETKEYVSTIEELRKQNSLQTANRSIIIQNNTDSQQPSRQETVSSIRARRSKGK